MQFGNKTKGVYINANTNNIIITCNPTTNSPEGILYIFMDFRSDLTIGSRVHYDISNIYDE